MDDTTKLSPKLLSALLKLLKQQTGGADSQPDTLLQTLKPEQQQAVQQILNDPQKLQALLQNPKVLSFLRALQKNTDDHGTGTL